MPNRIKACGYVRMVTCQPDDSSDGQRERIIEMAEREGYEIIKWYTDKSYVETKRVIERPALSKLLADAPNSKWITVLSDDMSRLCRKGSTEANAIRHIFIKAGKCLHTVAEGLFEWRTMQGRLLVVMQQEMQSTYATQLAHATLKGKLNSFLSGGRPGVKCPYGYACQITDPHGTTHRISREEDFAVPKGWSKILVPGDPVEVEAVRWLFDTYASTDTGIAALAQQLNARGVPSPTGRGWKASTVAHILANDLYVGDTRFGRRSSGQFVRLHDNGSVMVRHDISSALHEGTVRRNTHEAIVSRELWDRVQEKLNRR